MIRRAMKKGLKVAKAAAGAARGFVEGPLGPGHGVAEYDDFERLRAEAAAQDRAEGVTADPGDDLEAIADGTSEISAEELRVELEIQDGDDRPLLLDVRESHEWRSGRLDGAVHIPLGELHGRLDELDPERLTVVYCASGMRSIDGSYVLKRHGWGDVRSLAGGIQAWQLAGNPVVPG